MNASRLTAGLAKSMACSRIFIRLPHL